jgi:predicted enzyme related to lactoylglutathione lyase
MAPFLWHELNTTDPHEAADFYGTVVGWTTRAYEGVDDYRLFITGGQPAGGLTHLPAMARESEPWWATYIGVADVDAEAQAIREAGGSIHTPPRDIPTVGRLATVADPQGAVFMILAPLPREAPAQPPPSDAPGHVGWHELHTSDEAAAFAFYAGRFGWEKGETMEMGAAGTYQIFNIDGAMAGGMMQSPQHRPHWLPYFIVTDIDAAAGAITHNGGQILHGPAEVPGGHFIVQGTDPQGALFAVTGPRKS